MAGVVDPQKTWQRPLWPGAEGRMKKKGGISGIWFQGKGRRFGLGPNAEHMMGV